MREIIRATSVHLDFTVNGGVDRAVEVHQARHKFHVGFAVRKERAVHFEEQAEFGGCPFLVGIVDAEFHELWVKLQFRHDRSALVCVRFVDCEGHFDAFAVNGDNTFGLHELTRANTLFEVFTNRSDCADNFSLDGGFGVKLLCGFTLTDDNLGGRLTDRKSVV